MSPNLSRGWPLLGQIPAFYGDTTGLLMRVVHQQGDVARFRLGRRTATVLAHPTHVRAILVDRASEFTKGGLLQRARRLLGDGLLTSEGEQHHSQRRCIQPVFARARVQEYGIGVPEIVVGHVAHWRDGDRVRIGEAMNTLTMRIVASALLGADIEDEAPLLGASLHRLARWAPLLVAPGGVALERTRIPVLGRLREAIEQVESVIDRRIADGGEGAPLLQALLNARQDGAPISPKLIRDEVMTNFLAGHDTTAAALTWTWLLLGAHPDVEQKVHEELTSGCPASPLLESVIQEVLRLYPPIGRMGRRPIRDVHLGDVLLPAGQPVFVSPFVTQRDSRWFPDPLAFRPTRWADGTPECPQFGYFPFGAGSRSCIGEHFARVVMLHVVRTVARTWRLRPTASALPALRSLLTLKPKGAVWMVAERRRVR